MSIELARLQGVSVADGLEAFIGLLEADDVAEEGEGGRGEMLDSSGLIVPKSRAHVEWKLIHRSNHHSSRSLVNSSWKKRTESARRWSNVPWLRHEPMNRLYEDLMLSDTDLSNSEEVVRKDSAVESWSSPDDSNNLSLGQHGYMHVVSLIDMAKHIRPSSMTPVILLAIFFCFVIFLSICRSINCCPFGLYSRPFPSLPLVSCNQGKGRKI